jgi:glycosyltransferase involved in cell wall biosynthesis
LLKILFTIPNFHTAGSGKALLNIAKGLDKSKFEVHMACKTDEGAFFQEVKNSDIPVHVLNYEATMRPISKFLKESWKISRELKKINPDIIHSFHYSNNYGEVLPARLAGAKWIFTKKNMMWGSDGANAWKIRSALATKIIIQNEEMKRMFYPNSNKTMLIERGILLDKFYPSKPDASIRERMNTPVDARIIIAVANLAHIKGIDILLAAFAQLAEQFPDWHVWIVGDDQTKTGGALHHFVKQQKLADRVHFSGVQSEVTAYLNHAEIFVLPTRATGEGSPVALIEAMANAKVVLGAEVPGINDQLKGVPHHLFEPENPDALAEKLEHFLKNDSETNTVLGQSFLKHARANYSLQREVKAHEGVYLNVMGY